MAKICKIKKQKTTYPVSNSAKTIAKLHKSAAYEYPWPAITSGAV